jgi:enoyl-CoA hydratase
MVFPGGGVICKSSGAVISVILNRPETINSLDREMIRLAGACLHSCRDDPGCRLVMLRGAGERGFCAGGDIKSLAGAIHAGEFDRAMAFFREEYELDLAVHRFPRPVIAVADGITMGGGLGLAAGADIVLATERTHMAMPETRIGFFPDVGASGWLHEKCPPGYPEFLGLTGYEIRGRESVRLGLTDIIIPSVRLPKAIEAIEDINLDMARGYDDILEAVRETIAPFAVTPPGKEEAMDEWVRLNFHGKEDVTKLLHDLSQCAGEAALCGSVFDRISERSPTALALTLALIHVNRGRPLKEVFAAELAAAAFIIRHHDYYEGIRARLIDRDNAPRWDPGRVEDVDLSSLELPAGD